MFTRIFSYCFMAVQRSTVATMLLLPHLFQAAADSRAAAEPHAVSYVDFLTVTLTAVCALLAGLGLFLGFGAIWGYLTIKKEIVKAVTKKAEQRIDKEIGEYPDSKEVIALFDKMSAFHSQQVMLSSQLLTNSHPVSTIRASKKGQVKPKDSGSLAKDYPGKGK